MTANLVIIQLLHTQSNHVDFLRLCWDNLSQEQKRQIFYFLYNAEQYKTFLMMVRSELNNPVEAIIPWSHLFSIFEKTGRLDPVLVKVFSSSSQSADELGLFRLQNPFLLELWQDRRKKAQEAHENKKEELLISLNFAKQQGLRDQRNKVLMQLKKLYPDDTTVDVAFHEEKELQARSTLSKIAAKKNQAPLHEVSSVRPDKKMVSEMKKAALKELKKNKKMVLDFAIMFFQAELYPEALAMLDTVKKKSVDLMWHELQISIEARQFARALSVIQVLREKKEINGEKSFSLLYFEALALHGLGRHTEARQIIKHIVRIRPHFKSAASLLLEWETDK